MEYLLVILTAAAIFGCCFLLDKLFVKTFRNKAQHRSGTAVRANKRYGIFGVILTALGLLALVNGIVEDVIMLWGGLFVLALGLGLAVYYLGFGVFYDTETFLICCPGKKDRVYRFQDIQSQRLYLLQGGNVMVELYLSDGTTLSVHGNMDGMYAFLDAAFASWCAQKGLDPNDCDFHDPSNSLWFPTAEEV